MNHSVIIQDQHWRKYWIWVKKCHEKALEDQISLEREYRRLCSERDKLRENQDLEIMREYDIVGLTTARAAKLHNMLENLSAPIGH